MTARFTVKHGAVHWGSLPVRDPEALLAFYLRDPNAGPQYWSLHSAMEEVGLIPARPVPPSFDVSQFAAVSHEPAEAFQ